MGMSYRSPPCPAPPGCTQTLWNSLPQRGALQKQLPVEQSRASRSLPLPALSCSCGSIQLPLRLQQSEQ